MYIDHNHNNNNSSSGNNNNHHLTFHELYKVCWPMLLASLSLSRSLVTTSLDASHINLHWIYNACRPVRTRGQQQKYNISSV
jgi:hypothetical protein